MLILVTGVNGYLGKRIVNKLTSKKIFVYPVTHQKCDLNNISHVKLLFNTIKPDVVIHCAAEVPKRIEDYNDRRMAFNSLEMLSNILCSSDCPIVYISSMTAEYHNSVYAQYKLKCEKLLSIGNRDSYSVRLPGLFGLPRRNGLVYNIIKSLKYGGEINLPEKPIYWAAMHVEDAAEQVIKIATNKIKGKNLISIGYKGEHSIDKFYKLACKLYNHKYNYDIIHPIVQYNTGKSFKDVLIKFGDEI